MVGRALQLALREMQRHFSDRRVLAGMAVVAVLLGFTGPFGTFDQLKLGPRIAYWAAIVVSTYGFGRAVATFVSRLFGLKVQRAWARVLVFGALTGVPVTLAVLAVNFAAFGMSGLDPLSLWLQCTLIGMGVITITEIFDSSRRVVPAGTLPLASASAMPAGETPAGAVAIEATMATHPPATDVTPPILDRVPLPSRGALWALVVQDHYVEIVTSRGRTLVLMRLGDAIREVGAAPGVQIHRSHWVALGAVATVVKAGGKPAVELPDGRRLGISRGYMDAARAAGLVI